MKLSSINYSQFDENDSSWHIKDFTLGDVNLIVGQNSTGKSRVLNVIASLGNLITGKSNVLNGSFDAKFKSKELKINYKVSSDGKKILSESLIIDDKELLNRDSNGEGKIYAAEIGGELKFQLNQNVVAAFGKKDKFQHPFLNYLHDWSAEIRHFQFGTYLGKDRITLVDSSKELGDVDQQDTNNVVTLFLYTQAKFGDVFANNVLSDINELGYELTDIGVSALDGVQVQGLNSNQVPSGIFIKEKSHNHKVEQQEISQGLFRVISVFIQLRSYELFGSSGLIIIDDIGEGLDYERSVSFIKAVISTCKKSNVQLVMATNDRFIMNSVPLEYWCVLTRNGGECTVQNYRNSKELFDDFDFTGLSNFDFFTSKYYKRGLDVD
jgi:predicted ATPase